MCSSDLNPGIVAVLAEPVQGEGGARIASPEYLQALREMCNLHGWLLMVDEVQTGMGRTGSWFGFQHAEIQPDVITLAKGLGNGIPIGACLARGKSAWLFSPGHHGSTFGGNPFACRVACRVVEIMERDHIPTRAAILGARLGKALRTALADTPEVLSVRSHGLMAGVEMSFPCSSLVATALEREKLLITVTREKTIRLLPPLVCTEDEIDDIAQRVSRLVHQAIAPY